MPRPIAAKYLGQVTRPDFPARDLDSADFARMTEDQVELLKSLDGVYEIDYDYDEDEERPINYNKLRKPELVALANERGIDSSGTADELREALAAAEKA